MLYKICPNQQFTNTPLTKGHLPNVTTVFLVNSVAFLEREYSIIIIIIV